MTVKKAQALLANPIYPSDLSHEDAVDLALAYIAQAAEIGRLKAIIRVNGLRAGATHAEIDALIKGDSDE